MSRRFQKAVLLLGIAGGAISGGWLVAGRLDGPWGMLPGGAFDAPGLPCESAVWDRFAAVREVEVEVRPRRPRSVTTWSVVHEGVLFLPADFLTPWKRWPQQVLRDDRIRLRVDGRVYACRAERVDDEDLIRDLRRMAAAKYGLEPEGRAARAEVWWFRVGPRPPGGSS